MKKIITITAALYFSFGFVFSLYAYSPSLKSFTCTAPSEPHGYIGIGGMWINPDPTQCTRDGFELRSISMIPFFTVTGPIILTVRYVGARLQEPYPTYKTY